MNRYGKLISSFYNQELWTSLEKSNIGTHFCFYVLNKFGSLERAARIFYIILTFVYRLRKSINHHPLHTRKNENVIKNRFLITYERFLNLYNEPALQTQFRLVEAADEAGQPVVRRWQFDLVLFILIKHLQQHLHYEVFI